MKTQETGTANRKMADIILSLTVITLYVNGINILIKSQRLVEWIKKDPTICTL